MMQILFDDLKNVLQIFIILRNALFLPFAKSNILSFEIKLMLTLSLEAYTFDEAYAVFQRIQTSNPIAAIQMIGKDRVNLNKIIKTVREVSNSGKILQSFYRVGMTKLNLK